MPVRKDTLAILGSMGTADVSDALGLPERFQTDPAMWPLFPGIRFARPTPAYLRSRGDE